MTSHHVPSSAVPHHGQFTVLTAFSVALVAMTLAWALVDARLLNETPVWVKPFKFALSFAVMFGTLALVEQRLSAAWRHGWTIRTTAAVMATAMFIEMAYMIFMATQQQASHFNRSTPFTAMMYSVMGVGAVALMMGVAVIGAAALRDVEADLGPASRWGIGWGFILSLVLTLVTAGYMAATGTHVGETIAPAVNLPLMGWSASVGDIRPAHFLALHAMQALPMAGLWFDRTGIGVRHMKWLALGYPAMTVAVFAQALAGLPLIRISGAM